MSEPIQKNGRKYLDKHGKNGVKKKDGKQMGFRLEGENEWGNKKEIQAQVQIF